MLKLKYYLWNPCLTSIEFFSLVQQQERQLNGHNPAKSKGFINNSNTQEWRFQNVTDNYQNNSWKMQGRGRSTNQGKQCSYCHKMNHMDTTNVCYSKHGFLSWMKQRYKNNINQIESENQSQSPMEEGQLNHVENKQVVDSLTSDQIQQLLKILHNLEGKIQQINSLGEPSTALSNEKGKNSYWILDTGATDHVTYMKIFSLVFTKSNL